MIDKILEYLLKYVPDDKMEKVVEITAFIIVVSLLLIFIAGYALGWAVFVKYTVWLVE